MNKSLQVNIQSYAQRPDLIDECERFLDKLWPQFMSQSSVCDEYWERLDEEPYSHFQFIATVNENSLERVVGIIRSVPFLWPYGDFSKLAEMGWDAIFNFAMENQQGGEPYISALSVTVDPQYRGQQIPALLINALKTAAQSHGAKSVIVPVRPTLKHRYPLQDFDEYCGWKNEQGEPFDPWIRTHWRLGATVLQPVHRSMVITGSIADWQSWTDMKYPQSGQYIISGALVPVTADVLRQQVEYIEPNLWMLHSL
ncbi:GNAT family N-acetyltransferase [Providencia rettgeri]|uniref:GNAT family N-acetyltransferase n=1 Tax=Providencia sp. PROV269 TaxID=2949957 RepID=UPI002349BE5D|nr:GNAT family N-acetyltransferase [Providencia sp. PROV269]ELR5297433.1 GNAT family N-acetyltransferase [Providencia rettgeri]ELR5298078.1 GNAT family N-acetyltransferase [Providencia rettgeri]MCL0013882.1 GNAT family N-acetyltransferase [Providencia rettgeri]